MEEKLFDVVIRVNNILAKDREDAIRKAFDILNSSCGIVKIEVFKHKGVRADVNDKMGEVKGSGP